MYKRKKYQMPRELFLGYLTLTEFDEVSYKSKRRGPDPIEFSYFKNAWLYPVFVLKLELFRRLNGTIKNNKGT